MPQYPRNNPAHRSTYCQRVFGKLGLAALVVLGLLACTQAVHATTYTIVASTNSNDAFGTISPTGNVSVNAGDSQTFTATPTAPGYRLAYFQVDSLPPVTGVTSYTFTNVQANHNIVAVFSNTYYITASVDATGGGTISPPGQTPVNFGGSLAVVITPDSGNLVTDVLVDGVSVGAVTLYTFNNVSADHTIVAKFASGTHTLTLLFDQSAYQGDVWIQVQDPSSASGQSTYNPATTFQATYANGAKSIDFTDATDNSKTDMMSKPVKLSDIGAGGLKVANAYSVTLFVFYDDPTPNIRTAAPSQMDSTLRFMPVELDMEGKAGNGGDLEAINYFTAPLRLRSYNLDPIQNPDKPALQEAGFGSATAAGIGARLLINSKGKSGTAVKNSKGQIIRYLGPNNYITAANPWPSFVPYTKSIPASQNTKIQNSNSFIFPNQPEPKYTFGTDNMIATTDANGNLSITGRITVQVQGTIKTGTHINPIPPASGYWDGATFSYDASNETDFNGAIYGQVRTPAVTFTNETDPTSAWGQFKKFCDDTWMDPNKPYDQTTNPNLNDKFSGGQAYKTTTDLFIGDVTTGLNGGFFNSATTGTTTYPVTTTKIIKDMTSLQWWNLNPMLVFSKTQPSHTYYNVYAEPIFQASNNSVYGLPYSDRFGGLSPLINSVIYKTAAGVSYYVNYWLIGIGAPLPAAASLGGTLDLLLLK